MKTKQIGIGILITTLFLYCLSVSGQTTINLQGGMSENRETTNTVLTYQLGLRHQFNNIGFKAIFNQTDGLYHTFDSYTLGLTYQPLEAIYGSVGYRYDNARGWGKDRNGINLGLNGLIPIQEVTKIIVSADTTISDIIITNIMVGVQLDLRLRKTGTNRFY